LVNPKTNVEYLDFLTARLSEFIDQFDRFMELHVENAGPDSMARGIAPADFRSKVRTQLESGHSQPSCIGWPALSWT
jgi:hypothetical protein